MMDDAQRSEHINKVIEAKLSELTEYCDAVQVFATWTGKDDPDNTHSSFKGFGNWYSRIGMVKRFNEEENAKVHAQMWDESDDCSE
jgi:hypothetical protein